MRNAFYILLLTTLWSLTFVGPTKMIDAQQVQPGTNGVVSIDGFTATDAIEDTASNLPSPVSSFPAMTLPTSADPLVTKNRNEPTNESFTPPQLQQNISPNSSLPNQLGQSEFTDLFSEQAEQLTSREGLSPSIKIGIMLGILSLAPAIILMTTCYVRLIVVLTLLRQAFGAQQLPPTQVLTALSIFITLLVMAPIWNEVKTTAIDPYTQTENGIAGKKRSTEVRYRSSVLWLSKLRWPRMNNRLPCSIKTYPINQVRCPNPCPRTCRATCKKSRSMCCCRRFSSANSKLLSYWDSRFTCRF